MSGTQTTAVQDYASNGKGWGKVAIPLLTNAHQSSIPEWRRAWLEGFLEGVTEYVKEALEQEPKPHLYECGLCGETFPEGTTGHTDDNPCSY